MPEAVRSIDLLGITVISLAVTVEALPSASGAALDVTSFYVELAFGSDTVMTGPSIRAPVVWLIAVANARNVLACDDAGLNCLRLAKTLGPTFYH